MASRLRGSCPFAQRYQEGPGPRAILKLGGALMSTPTASGFPPLGPASGQVFNTRRPSRGPPHSLGQGGSRKPFGSPRKEREEGARSLQKTSPRGTLRRPRGRPEVPATTARLAPPHGGGRGAQLRPRARQRAGRGTACGHLLAPPPGPRPLRRRLPPWKAARRVRTGALAARPVGSPGRAGGGNVGRSRAAHPPSLPPARPTPSGPDTPRRPSNERRR